MKAWPALMLALAACEPAPLKPPPNPPPPTEGEPCARACARLEQLGCPEAKPEPGLDGKPGTADDVPCLEWMCSAEFLDHEALAVASSCAEFQE